MIRKLLATTAITTIALTSAYAANEPAAGASAAERFVPAIGEASLASTLIGETVYASTVDNADSIGEVNDLLVDKDGNIAAALIGVGGFLGVGEKNVAVNYDDLQMTVDPDGDRVVVLETTKEELEAAPAFVVETVDGTAAAPVVAPDNMTAATPAPATTTETAAPVATDQVAARDTLKSLDIGTISSDNVIGTTIYSADDQNVGEISEVIMTDDGKIEAAIIDVGGFLGMGAKPVAVSFSDLDFRSDDSGNIYVYTALTEAQLQAAPDYVAADYPNNRDTMLVKSKN